MMLTMYAIKDELNGFTCPIPMISDEVAERYFKDQMLGNPTMQNSPKDFSLWKMGEFDSEIGYYTNNENGPALIQRGDNYVN